MAVRPASVVRYCYFELRGFFGIVISRSPASSSGATTRDRKRVLFLSPEGAIRSNLLRVAGACLWFAPRHGSGGAVACGYTTAQGVTLMVEDEVVAVTVRSVKVPLDKPSKESLLAEAAALGDSFSEVTSHPADLIADAEEMLQARADAKALAKRGYYVSDAQFARVELLVKLLKPLIAQQARQTEASKVKTAAAEAARSRLIAIRGALARIGAAAGLPAGLFSLDTTNTQRLNVVMMKMEEVLDNVRAYRKHLPDLKRVDELVTEARALLDEQKSSRSQARFLRTDRQLDGRTAGRLQRLLLDVMQHLSAQGLAAFPDDTSREARYRLDHVYGRRPSKVGDPGAGGPSASAPAPS